jgi:CheY-like chemotaxis protein
MTGPAVPTVLIIDDDEAVRTIVRRVLERRGYRVRDATDGAAGVRSYREEQSDVVITDLFMPEQDGIETIQLLRAEFPEYRIIAMSGGSRGETSGPLEDARLLGADVALSKPFTPDLLGRTVDELLGRSA